MDKKSLSIPHWQALAVGVLGAWLAASPWVVQPAASGVVSGLCAALGVGLVVTAVAMTRPAQAPWGAWLAVVLGLVAAVSPWLLGFSDESVATVSTSVAGLAAALLAFMVGLTTIDPDRWWDDRVAQ